MILSLAFLLGCWQAQINSQPTVLIERYRQVVPGLIEGTSTTVAAGKTVSQEFIEIQEAWNGTILTTYFNEEDSAQFRLLNQEPNRAVFENLQQDLPRRMVYEKMGEEALVLSLYGKDDGEAPSHSIVFSACR